MRANIRRMTTAGAAVVTAIAATVGIGLGASAAQHTAQGTARGTAQSAGYDTKARSAEQGSGHGSGKKTAAGLPRPAVPNAVLSEADVSQGGLYRIVSQRYEALDLDNRETEDGARVQTWEKNDTSAQVWRFWDAGEGGYLAETTVPGGADKVLDGDMTNGLANLWQIHRTNGDPNQHWSFEAAGSGWFRIHNGEKGCLTAGAKAGDQVTVNNCGNDFAQLWCLESAEPKSGPTTEKGIRGETARAIETGKSAAPARTLDSPPVNTDYLVVDVAKAQAPGRTGVSVHWIGPDHRNPYREWDWIEVLDSSGSRVTWDWVCPKKSNHCDGADGATFIDTGDLPSTKVYTVKYWSNGGVVSYGTLRATAEFVS
ncbi:RICIN domain-containing protein [Streptomyces sp. NPDC046203]|uniref:RICIN domain-containing protein n=1 Tax=Streptomyces sp. NPDC046203 TaxID=3154602 RepID=UPI0033EBF439